MRRPPLLDCCAGCRQSGRGVASLTCRQNDGRREPAVEQSSGSRLRPCTLPATGSGYSGTGTEQLLRRPSCTGDQAAAPKPGSLCPQSSWCRPAQLAGSWARCAGGPAQSWHVDGSRCHCAPSAACRGARLRPHAPEAPAAQPALEAGSKAGPCARDQAQAASAADARAAQAPQAAQGRAAERAQAAGPCGASQPHAGRWVCTVVVAVQLMLSWPCHWLVVVQLCGAQSCLQASTLLC